VFAKGLPQVFNKTWRNTTDQRVGL